MAPAASRQFGSKRRARFLAALADTLSASAAARAAGVSRQTCYRRRAADPAFRDDWDDALEDGLDALEDEAGRRAFGWDEPVYHRGRQVGTRRVHSDRLLELLLVIRRPEPYGDRRQVVVGGGLTLERLITAPRGAADVAWTSERRSRARTTALLARGRRALVAGHARPAPGGAAA